MKDNMERIKKYQTTGYTTKTGDDGTPTVNRLLPEVEVSDKLPTIGAYRQYVNNKNSEFQVTDDGTVIPTSSAVWTDFLNPSYTPDNFGIEDYKDFKTKYEDSDGQYYPMNLQYAGAGFPILSNLIKLPRLARGLKKLKSLNRLKRINKIKETKNLQTFSEHLNSVSKVSNTTKVGGVVDKTKTAVQTKWGSIPTWAKIGGGSAGLGYGYMKDKDQTGGFQRYGSGGTVSGTGDPYDYGNTNDTQGNEGNEVSNTSSGSGSGSGSPYGQGSTGGSYSGGQSGWLQDAGNWYLDNVGHNVLKYSAGWMGIPNGDYKGNLDRYNNIFDKHGALGVAGDMGGRMLGAQLKRTVTGGLGNFGKSVLPSLPGGKWLSNKFGWRDGGFTHQTGGMQNAYSSPEAIQPLQQMQQIQQKQPMYSDEQPQPQMYQTQGNEQESSVLDKIESTTRVRGGKLVPIGNGVAIEGNKHDESEEYAIDGFTEGVEFAPGKAGEGGEVLANAQVNGNSGEYMFSEAMKMNGEFGYKKGLGPSIADGAKEILSAGLPTHIEQEKLNSLALMQENTKPDTDEHGMAKKYEYSRLGGFPNRKYQTTGTVYVDDQEASKLFNENFTDIHGDPLPIYDPNNLIPINKTANNKPVNNNTSTNKTANKGDGNYVKPNYIKWLEENKLTDSDESKNKFIAYDENLYKNRYNLKVASTDMWDYGTIPSKQGTAKTKGGLTFYNKDKKLAEWVNTEGFGDEWLSNIDQDIRESIGISSINDMNNEDKVRAYQKAWNAKYPNDQIQVDGKFGEQTIRTARLGSTDEGESSCVGGNCNDNNTEENLNNTISNMSTLDQIEENKKGRWGRGMNKIGQYLSKNGLDLIAGGIQLAGPIAAYKKPIRTASAVTTPGYKGSRVNYDSLISEAKQQANARKQDARNNITGPGLEEALAKIDAELQGTIMKIKNGESNQNLSLQDSEAKINTQINLGNATAINKINEFNTKNLIQHDVDKVEAIDRASNRIANVIGNYQDRKTREFTAEVLSGETGVYTRMNFQKETGMTAASNPEAYIKWLELNNPAMLTRLKKDHLTTENNEESKETKKS